MHEIALSSWWWFFIPGTLAIFCILFCNLVCVSDKWDPWLTAGCMIATGVSFIFGLPVIGDIWTFSEGSVIFPIIPALWQSEMNGYMALMVVAIGEIFNALLFLIFFSNIRCEYFKG